MLDKTLLKINRDKNKPSKLQQEQQHRVMLRELHMVTKIKTWFCLKSNRTKVHNYNLQRILSNLQNTLKANATAHPQGRRKWIS